MFNDKDEITICRELGTKKNLSARRKSSRWRPRYRLCVLTTEPREILGELGHGELGHLLGSYVARISDP